MTVAVSDGQSGPPISLGCATTISLLSAFQELQVALGEALLMPLAKRLHDVVSAMAVPLPGLGRMPLHIGVEDLLARLEVALTPSLQALPRDLGRLAIHLNRIRPYFKGRRASLSVARFGWPPRAGFTPVALACTRPTDGTARTAS
jgi:hypothetical protein